MPDSSRGAAVRPNAPRRSRRHPLTTKRNSLGCIESGRRAGLWSARSRAVPQALARRVLQCRHRGAAARRPGSGDLRCPPRAGGRVIGAQLRAVDSPHLSGYPATPSDPRRRAATSALCADISGGPRRPLGGPPGTEARITSPGRTTPAVSGGGRSTRRRRAPERSPPSTDRAAAAVPVGTTRVEGGTSGNGGHRSRHPRSSDDP